MGRRHIPTRFVPSASGDLDLVQLCRHPPPCRYMPVVPTVLVNGAEGIGTGWSTSIPNFNPRDLVANLRRLLDGEQPVTMKPWYRGFNGTIEEVRGGVGGCEGAAEGRVRCWLLLSFCGCPWGVQGWVASFVGQQRGVGWLSSAWVGKA